MFIDIEVMGKKEREYDCPSTRGPYVCCRNARHKPPHIATMVVSVETDCAVAVWDDDRSTDEEES